MPSYSNEKLLQIWRKGLQIPNRNPALFRMDRYGNEIHWTKYGNRKSRFGWEVHHVRPVSDGGTDVLHNLIPVQWATNLDLGNSNRIRKR